MMKVSNKEIILSRAQLSLLEIKQVLELDSLVYEPEYCSEFDQVVGRFNKNKDCFITLRNQDDIIAYICFFPITKRLANMISSGNFTNDAEILPTDVLSYEDSEGVLYIISVVVKPEYHNSDVVKRMMIDFENKVQELSELYNIKSVLATAISEKGHSTLLKSKFQDIVVNQRKSIYIMEKIY